MSRVRKARAARKNRQTRRWLVAAPILVAIVAAVAVGYFWNPTQTSANNASSESAEFKIFKEHYLAVMKNLNSTQTRAEMAQQLDPDWNQTDLFAWEKSKLIFANDPAGSLEDPIQVLNSGKGVCTQWSIVYASACLALNYPCRLVVAADTSNWNFIHVWAEDYFNGSWVHVDPSDSIWDNPSRYLTWDWGTEIGSGVKIYAFCDTGFEDVTSNYLPHSP